MGFPVADGSDPTLTQRLLPELLKRHGLIAAVLLLACGYFPWACNDSMGQLGSDGGSYLMMAQHYAPYGAHDPVDAEAATASRFPPLYPMLLAWSGSAHDLLRAHATTIACLLLALIALYLWASEEGLSAPIQAIPCRCILCNGCRTALTLSTEVLPPGTRVKSACLLFWRNCTTEVSP